MRWLYCVLLTFIWIQNALFANDICGTYNVDSISNLDGNIIVFKLGYTIEEKEKSKDNDIVYVVKNSTCVLEQKGKIFEDGIKKKSLKNGNGLLSQIDEKYLEYKKDVCINDNTKENIMVGPLSDISDNMRNGVGRKTKLIYTNEVDAIIIKSDEVKIELYNYKIEKEQVICYKAMYFEKNDHKYTVYIKHEKMQLLKIEYCRMRCENKYNDIVDVLKKKNCVIFEKLKKEMKN